MSEIKDTYQCMQGCDPDPNQPTVMSMSKILETVLDQSSHLFTAALDLRSKYGHHAEAKAQRMVDFNEAWQGYDQISFWLAVLEPLAADHQATRH